MISLTKKKAGFSLIQISVLLTAASLVMVAVLPSYQRQLKSNSNIMTKMNSVMSALRQYEVANNTLPCPADPTLATGNSNYGVAAANVGTTNNCIGSTPAAAYADSSKHIAIGMIPVTTLGLSYDYAVDDYGRDITYAVDTNATATCWSPSVYSQPGTITVSDNGLTKNAVAVLVSHGADGYGGWLPVQGTGGTGTATRLNSGSTDTNQAHNAQVATGGGLTPLTSGNFANFIKQNATSTFDDLVVYKSPFYNLNILPATYAQSSAYLNNCGPFYRTITIDYTKVPNTDQTNFPVLFSGTYSYLATRANGGYATNSSGYDIYFSSDAAGQNILPFERESYSPTTGQVTFWVKVPTVSHTANTVFYLQYANSAITTDQSSKTSTWDSYYNGVWHLSETSGTQYDSTSHANNLSQSVSWAAQGETATSIAGGADQETTSSQGEYANGMNSTLNPTDFTVEVWAYMTAWNPATDSSTIMETDSGSSPYLSYALFFSSNASNQHYPCTAWANSGGSTYYACGTTIDSLNTWYHLVGTYKSSTHTLTTYLNGTSVATTTTSGTVNTSITGFGIGNNGNTSPPQWPTGYFDEMRISSTYRSADWIKTEYNNMSSPSTFYAIGAQTSTSR